MRIWIAGKWRGKSLRNELPARNEDARNGEKNIEVEIVRRETAIDRRETMTETVRDTS